MRTVVRLTHNRREEELLDCVFRRAIPLRGLAPWGKHPRERHLGETFRHAPHPEEAAGNAAVAKGEGLML
jgi:hypothetical protein